MSRRRHLVLASEKVLWSFFLSLSLTYCWVTGLRAQSSPATSSTDGTTPTALTPGSPAGSYALSGFDTISLYNGSLNFRLPLVHIQGRGNAPMSMMLPIQQKWRVDHLELQNTTGTGTHPKYIPKPDWWSTGFPYSPGSTEGRSVGDGIQPCLQTGDLSTVTLTRLTFTPADGTEYELRDVQNAGQPLAVNCNLAAPSRGTVFATADGTSATFISDTTISDYTMAPSGSNGDFFPSGYLFLANGSRYRIDQGRVTSMRDRNGNTLTFAYEQSTTPSGQILLGRLLQVTDSLGRAVNLQYQVQDPTFGLSDIITFKGVNATPRTIHISYANLGNVLRGTQTLQTPAQLFPELNGASSTTLFNPTVVAAVWLPDGKLHYQFFYNSYGELARVVLPTGGAFEYDYAGGVVNGPASGAVGPDQIYRRVVERRVYADGNVLTERMTYSEPESQTTGGYSNLGYVEATHYDPSSGAILANERHFFLGNGPANALFNGGVDLSPVSYNVWKDGRESETDQGFPALRKQTNTWSQQPPNWWLGSNPNNTVDNAPENNPVISETDTLLVDTNQVSKQTFNYDQYTNKTDTYEYDFGSGVVGALVRHTQTGYLTINNGSSYDTVGADALHTIHLRNLPLSESVYDGAGALQAQTQFEYDIYSEGLTASGAVQHDAAFSTAYTTRGNVTAVKRWRNTDAALLTTRNQYDDAGNVRKSVDPKGNPTTFSFADSWGNAACLPTGGSAAAYLTSTTNALGQVTTTAYDSCTGRPTSSTDANGQTTSLAYNDALERLTNVTRPTGGGSSNFTYDDVSHIITTASDLNALGDGGLKTATVYDGLGRTVETRQYESAFGFIAVDTSYDALGRKKTVSNPFRSTTDPTYGLTTFGYDALSRVTSVTTSDGAVVTTSYSGNSTTVTDQAGKARRSVSDALGRLTQVVEDPLGLAYPTNYTYDAQDDLTGAQQGIQARTFSYNSLKQLTNATNPESGTLSYAYDANGNLTSKTDARGITTSYAYDALNRVTSRSYSDLVTPAVNYNYDAVGVANSKGRLTQASSSVSATNYTGYDALGRVTASSQTTNGQTYTLGYGYNLAGGMTSQTYPSGRIVTTSYDAAGRVNAVSGTKTGESNKTYASLIGYAPQGAMSSMTMGNTLVESTAFNNRLQPTSISLGTLASFGYTYGTANNNGNVLSQAITAPGFNVTQNYTYDQLNRLASLNESGLWSQSYGYDQYGNRTSVTSPTYMPTYAPAPSINASNNRISDVNFAYDLAGNLTQAPPAPGAAVQTLAYDAENKLVNFNNGGGTYAYDGDGRRVKKVVGTTTTIFVYNTQDQLVAEYTNPAPTTSGGTNYLTADHLGSTRVVTNSSGTVIARHDYLPFGDEIPSGIGGRTTTMGYGLNDGINQKFTAKERDTESGLDNFGFRFFGSTVGRFQSPDEPFGGQDQHDPQTWNLYGYVRDNPLIAIDPDGHDVRVCTKDENGKETCTNLSDEEYRKAAEAQNKANQGINVPIGLFPSGNITCGGQVCGHAQYFEPGVVDETNTFVNAILFIQGLRGVYSLGRAAFTGIRSFFSREAAEEGGVVIGKMADLNAPGALRAGERQLDLPNLIDPKANWAQNSSKLREVMAEGRPIRDVSVNEKGELIKNAGFLRAERNLLENHGWKFDPATTSWYPPK